MGFQTTVNLQQAPAVAGDFATANPRASFPAGEGQYVAASAGVTVGRFAWIDSSTGLVSNAGTGKPDGFIHREQQALISTYLAESSNMIPQGFPVTVMRTGDYFATATVGAATKGQKAFAKLTDGTVQAGAAGATISGFIETDFVITQAAALNELAVISL
ncbi:MAG: structural cement protein Gp24 [Aeromonadaceae bacterium]